MLEIKKKQSGSWESSLLLKMSIDCLSLTLISSGLKQMLVSEVV